VKIKYLSIEINKLLSVIISFHQAIMARYYYVACCVPKFVLFLGAGASYGALDIEEELRPPLSKDLMAHLMKAFLT
jgi:hypothetical protein